MTLKIQALASKNGVETRREGVMFGISAPTQPRIS